VVVQPAQRYQLYITGLDPNKLARAFPETDVVVRSDASTLSGELDDRRLEAARRRLALLGGRLIGLSSTTTAGRDRAR
jgi:hypothetical protein